MPRISPLQVAMGVGASGAMVDVSAQVRFVEGISLQSGKSDEFRDTDPGTFTFVLENYDGRFTPGNLASSLVTLLNIGTSVSVNVGGKITAGSVQGIANLAGNENWGLLQITCDDMLGNAARTSFSDLATGMVLATKPYLFWPLNDPSGSLSALEATGNGGPLNLYFGYGGSSYHYSFGASSALPVTSAYSVSASDSFSLRATAFGPISFTSNNWSWGFWGIRTGLDGPGLTVKYGPNVMDAVFVVPSSATVAGVPFYASMDFQNTFSAGTWSTAWQKLINGVVLTSGTTTGWTSFTNADRVPLSVEFIAGSTIAPDPTFFAHISYTATSTKEYLAGITTIPGRLTGIDLTTPEVTLATLPSDLSTAVVGVGVQSGSVLEAFNDVIRTEQGSIDTVTTGTLLSPVQAVRVRARARSVTPTATFDAQTELSEPVQFLYDLTNMVSTETVNGIGGNSVIVTDPTAASLVGSANAADNVVFQDPLDMRAWGQDRITRGRNPNLRVAPVQIDALVTPTDRSAELLALRPGDRIRITNIPTNPFGISVWDGYLLGGSQTHSLTQHVFSLNLAPVVSQAIYDTDRFMSGGALTLASGITAGGVSIIVATTGPRVTTTDVPFQIIVEREVMTVTAVSAGATQVLTVTRGQGLAPAVAHTAGTPIELYPDSLFAY